jgi:hypothetical protein
MASSSSMYVAEEHGGEYISPVILTFHPVVLHLSGL